MDNCSIYESPSIINFVVSVGLTVGIYISYLPQHLKIIKRKSSEGLSSIFLLLGSASGCSSVINLWLLSSYSRYCCVNYLTSFQCLNSQLSLIQVGVQFVGYAMIPVLCVLVTKDSLSQDMNDYRKIYDSFIIFLLYFAINVVIVIYLLYFNNNLLLPFAKLSGISAALLGGLQYLPQIYTTHKLKHPGTLSLHMMMIQTPGGFLWTLTLYLAPGSNWSSWLPYFTAACLQGYLLVMCLYYGYKYNFKNLERQAVDEIVHENNANSNSVAQNANTDINGYTGNETDALLG
ncbi:hypothetical protein PACTADRAFT_1224 [Pachysolen tannophilus NRRL Y-2460]|uniref:Uncharacterized protein n=1 Tax=Pachysolen tannophilus NRRL Y-2460 TaxID=669874 RepID=A0A1E4TY20_PACTA|nr:hypothetical protein PACTADRAFT_1224 [Pachysolen tannophilus NRRL Y-2460]